MGRSAASSFNPLSRFYCPRTVKTNRCDGLLRLIACIAMLVDHLGAVYFPHLPVMRMVGRLAFPLFAYGIACGAVLTRDPLRYLSRVVLLALICQPLYAVALHHETHAMYAVSFRESPIGFLLNFYLNSYAAKPSILVSLSLGLSIMLSLRSRRFSLAFGLYILCTLLASKLDYGMNGIHIMLLFYALCETPLLFAPATIAFYLHWALSGSGYRILSYDFGLTVFALPAVLLCALPMNRSFVLPKWFTYGFYPAHLVLLILLKSVL